MNVLIPFIFTCQHATTSKTQSAQFFITSSAYAKKKVEKIKFIYIY